MFFSLLKQHAIFRRWHFNISREQFFLIISSKRWREKSQGGKFFFEGGVNAIFCSKLEDSEDESCEKENCAISRPTWREEAHQTIYWDKLNGRNPEPMLESGAWTTLASWFRHRRFSARDIKRRREGWVEGEGGGGRTRLRLTHSPPGAPSWTYSFFICNIMHQDILFFKNKGFKFNWKKKKINLYLIIAFIKL